MYNSTGIYILAKTDKLANYTLCEARSWVSPLCSTRFNISGIGGASLESYCADGDRNAYYQSFPKDQAWQEPLKDWKVCCQNLQRLSDAPREKQILTEMP